MAITDITKKDTKDGIKNLDKKSNDDKLSSFDNNANLKENKIEADNLVDIQELKDVNSKKREEEIKRRSRVMNDTNLEQTTQSFYASLLTGISQKITESDKSDWDKFMGGIGEALDSWLNPNSKWKDIYDESKQQADGIRGLSQVLVAGSTLKKYNKKQQAMINYFDGLYEKIKNEYKHHTILFLLAVCPNKDIAERIWAQLMVRFIDEELEGLDELESFGGVKI